MFNIGNTAFLPLFPPPHLITDLTSVSVVLLQGKAPWLEVATSTCADDWYKLLQDPHFHDVTFVVEGGRHVHAHRVLLSSASSFFAKLLGVPAGIQVRASHLRV